MTSIRLVRASLLGTLALGCLVTLLDTAWRPAYEAASVDEILTPAELSDPALIQIVYRTHRHNASGRDRFPLWVLGAMTAAASTIGLVGSRSYPLPYHLSSRFGEPELR
jgi:hypothetical protein